MYNDDFDLQAGSTPPVDPDDSREAAPVSVRRQPQFEGSWGKIRDLAKEVLVAEFALQSERTKRQRLEMECRTLAREWTRIQVSLSESQRFQTALVQCSMDAVVMIDEGARILGFNPAAERLFGRAVAQVLGQPIDQLIPALLLDRRPGDLVSRCTVEFIPGGSLIRGSLTAVTADGKPFLAEATVARLVIEGRRLSAITLRDISEQHRAEEALSRLSRAVEQTADGVCITDRRGVIEYVNPAFERLLGFAREQMVGNTPALFASGGQSRESYEALWQTLLSGEVYRHVFVDRCANGDLVHLDETITPVKDAEGNVTHFMASARDVTPRVRAEEALRGINDSLERQARSIAQALHDEAGQLLTAAHIAAADAARRLPPEAREPLAEVRRHLDGIEEELRRLAHELRPRMLDDLGLVPTLEFLARGFERRSGVAVFVEASVNDRLPAHAETLVYRVVQEALTNVGRHAGATRVDIQLAAKPGAALCRIADDGRGFDVSASPKGHDGSGFGLPGIRDRLHAIGGALHIDSAPGQGTEITFSLPLEPGSICAY
jgi:PAS domain S-box-containing protein